MSSVAVVVVVALSGVCAITGLVKAMEAVKASTPMTCVTFSLLELFKVSKKYSYVLRSTYPIPHGGGYT